MVAEFGTGEVFWSMLWFFLFTLWLMLLFTIFGDIFKSRDLSGWGKALWSILIIFLPFIGVFAYMIARGNKMTEHAMDESRRREDAMRGYVQEVVATTPATSGVDSLTQLANLHGQGVINDDEFARMKAKVLAV
jgi:hypothetical protein